MVSNKSGKSPRVEERRRRERGVASKKGKKLVLGGANLALIIYMGWGGVWVQLLRGHGARARVFLVLCECIWNAPGVLLVFPAFDDAGSLGFPRRQVVSPPV